jgi:hypothetical protein
VWKFPGTESEYCEELLVVPAIQSFRECFEYCRNTMGGPPYCAYFKYVESTKECFPAPSCDNILGLKMHERKLQAMQIEPRGRGEAGDVEATSEIVQLHCSFSRSLYETCLWADLEFGADYEAGYKPKWMGWDTLKSIVEEAEEAAAQGLLYAGNKTSDGLTEADIGLPRCSHECSDDPACSFFAYSEALMACVKLGDLDYTEFKQNCGYTLRNAGMLGDELTHNDQVREALYSVGQEVRALLNNFFIYMLQDEGFAVYNKTSVHDADESCTCINGCVPHKTDKLKCVPKLPWRSPSQRGLRGPPQRGLRGPTTSSSLLVIDPSPAVHVDSNGNSRSEEELAAHKDQAAREAAIAGGAALCPSQLVCNEITVSGPIAATQLQAWDYSQGLTAGFEDCVIFWDCNRDGKRDNSEDICVINGGKCFVEGRQNDLLPCPVIWDPVMQTGRDCANLKFRPEPFEVTVGLSTLNARLRSSKGPRALLATALDAKDKDGGSDASSAPAALRADLRSLRHLFPPTQRHAPNLFGRYLSALGTPTQRHAPYTRALGTPSVDDDKENEPSVCPVVPIELKTADDADPLHCRLCYLHSCTEIETEEFENRQLNKHQQTNIAFGFDPGYDCVADVIGACIFCEDGDSADPSMCALNQPEVLIKHWQACDALCEFQTCPEIEAVIGQHFLERYQMKLQDLNMYVHRFVLPLCSACDEDMQCMSAVYYEGKTEAYITDAVKDKAYTGEADDMSRSGIIIAELIKNGVIPNGTIMANNGPTVITTVTTITNNSGHLSTSTSTSSSGTDSISSSGTNNSAINAGKLKLMNALYMATSDTTDATDASSDASSITGATVENSQSLPLNQKIALQMQSLPLDQQQVLSKMDLVQQEMFIGADAAMQMSIAGFSLAPANISTITSEQLRMQAAGDEHGTDDQVSMLPPLEHASSIGVIELVGAALAAIGVGVMIARGRSERLSLELALGPQGNGNAVEGGNAVVLSPLQECTDVLTLVPTHADI